MRWLCLALLLLTTYTFSQGIGGKAGVGGKGGVGGGPPSGGPCSSVIATDTFTRANESPLAGNWTTMTGLDPLVLTSNQVQYTTAGNDAGAYYNAVTPNANQCDSLLIVNKGSDTNPDSTTGIGPCVRQSTGATTEYCAFVNNAATLNVVLIKNVAGVFTELWARTATCTAGSCTIQLRANSTTLQVFVDGVQLGADQVDSSIASGRCGIGYSSTDSGALVDNFECDNY